nr:hypothetical protein CFP56_09224 [Quercus suber]
MSDCCVPSVIVLTCSASMRIRFSSVTPPYVTTKPRYNAYALYASAQLYHRATVIDSCQTQHSFSLLVCSSMLPGLTSSESCGETVQMLQPPWSFGQKNGLRRVVGAISLFRQYFEKFRGFLPLHSQRQPIPPLVSAA